MSSVSPERNKTAAVVWSQLRDFVEANDPKHDIRGRLGLGRGGGRVKVMLLLIDGPKSLAELAVEQSVSPPYITSVIDQLEQLGLVERTLDEADKRRKIVTLTSAGREAVALAAELRATPPRALDVLTTDELLQLEALIARLAAVQATSRAEPKTRVAAEVQLL